MNTGYDYSGLSQRDQQLPEEAKRIIYESKQKWANAASDEERNAANQAAEQARADYGQYVAGEDGSGYHSFGVDAWSAADRNYFGDNPDAMLAYKKGYALADDPKDKAIWNQLANEYRSGYGYTGGLDGSEYNKIPLIDREFADTTPRPEINPYEAMYQSRLDDTLNQVQNSQFSYDYATDPSYQAYADAFARQGQSAAESGLATTAAATGGMPSSYAAAVANQAQQAYAKKTADIIPQLEQQAYQRYADQLNRYMNLADLYGGLEQQNYGRYADGRDFTMGQYNTDRDFSRDTFFGNQDNAWQKNNFDYQSGQDTKNWDWQQQQFDYQKEQDALDREFARDQFEEQKKNDLARRSASGGSSGSSGGNSTYKKYQGSGGNSGGGNRGNSGNSGGTAKKQYKMVYDPRYGMLSNGVANTVGLALQHIFQR